MFLPRYTFGLRCFCHSFDGLVCLVFSSALFVMFFSFLAVHLFLFFNFPLKLICFVFFLSAFSSGPFNFCQLLLLKLYSFPLISQISLKTSSLFFFTFIFQVNVFISCLYDRLSMFYLMAFLYSFLFLWYVSVVQPLICYNFLLSFFRPIPHFPRFIRCFSHTMSYQFTFVCS